MRVSMPKLSNPLRRHPKPPANPAAVMPIMGHLVELRSRLIKVCALILLGMVISFLFINNLVDIMLALVPQPDPTHPVHLIQLQPTETISVYFKVALIAGIIIAMPGIIYQILAFVTPGLTAGERRWIFTALPFVTVFFAAGLLFAYFIVLPSALNFLLGFGDPRIERQIQVSQFLSFVTTFTLAIGVVFLLPVFIYILARLHIVNTRLLKKARPYMIVLSFILAAFLSPSPDPVNQTIVAIPIILLFEVGVLLSRFIK